MKHLKFLDGLRACAALLVLVFHAFSQTSGMDLPPDWQQFSHRWLIHGQIGVVVFIVLSGYCLMLPVASDAKARLRGGVVGFFVRRFRRIYPAYVANIFLALALTWIAEKIFVWQDGRINATVHSVGWWDVLSHLMMLHVFKFETAFSINGVLWSVGTEAWIYIVFALLLVPIWRRIGTLPLVFLTVMLSNLPPYLAGSEYFLSWARPTYVGAFALGLAASTFSVSKRPVDVAIRIKIPWHLVASVLCGAVLALYLWEGLTTSWRNDLIVAVATSAGLVNMGTKSKSRVRTFFESPFLNTIAASSYTLYMFHSQVFKLLTGCGLLLHLSEIGILLVNVIIGIPLSLVVAHYLAKILERPFMSGNSSTATRSGEAGLPPKDEDGAG